VYLPQHFAQHDPLLLRGLVHAHPLATLVTPGADGVTVDHIPLELDPNDGPHGTLLGHVARANPLWKQAHGQAVVAVFNGPQVYITPSYYASKASTHKVVPTWNYSVVHAHGVLEAMDDAQWVHGLVTRLTRQHEGQRPAPWAVTDAPADYIQQMLRAIVGIRIPLTQLVGKWKVSQNRDAADRQGVAQGLLADGTSPALVPRLVQSLVPPLAPAGPKEVQ
jgi:transcriptional regulator